MEKTVGMGADDNQERQDAADNAVVTAATPLVEPPAGRIVGHCDARLWSMPAAHWQRRALLRAGTRDAAAWDGSVPAGAASVLLLRADCIPDMVLLKDLAAGAPGRVLVDAALRPVAACVDAADAPATAAALDGHGLLPPGLQVEGAATLSTAYRHKLRKREVPYVLQLTAREARAVEARMFMGAYKGVTDVVTKYLWPPLALPATRFCARLNISPNAVTWASLVLVLLAMAYFWKGWFLAGLAAAWGMTFLDTVDGKLARVTLSYSKLGDVFDHGIDLVHPPFWYWAWAVGLGALAYDMPEMPLLLAIVIGGYIAQRIEEGIFIACFGIEMHVWRRFDSFFRLITARRNPNLLLLTAAALIGRPDLGLWWVAVWTLLCFGVHATQIVQGFFAKRRGPLTSWLAAP